MRSVGLTLLSCHKRSALISSQYRVYPGFSEAGGVYDLETGRVEIVT